MPRQTWSDIRTRTHLILRNRNDTDILTRIEDWVMQAQAELGAAYRFFQLEGKATRVLAAAFDEISIADITDLNYTTSVRSLFHNRRLVRTTSRKLDNTTRPVGSPTRYIHYGSMLEFDRTADVDYTFMIRYKKIPIAPVYDGVAVPVLPIAWDDIIIYRAAKKGFKDLFEHELAEFCRVEEARLIAEIPTAETVEEEDLYHSMQPGSSR